MFVRVCIHACLCHACCVRVNVCFFVYSCVHTCRLAPLLYPSPQDERLYLQSHATAAMLAECEVPAAWEGLGVEVSGCTNLWVSTRGLVSPLHYDATHSFLAQVLLCLSVHVSVCVCVCDDAALMSGAGAFFLLPPFSLLHSLAASHRRITLSGYVCVLRSTRTRTHRYAGASA